MNHSPDVSRSTANTPLPSISAIQQWIVNRLAEELRIEPDRIDVERPILSLGIDSMHMISVISALEDWCGIRFPQNPLDDHATIEELARFVAEMISKKDRRP